MKSSTFTFFTDLPDALKRLHFNLITETGPQPIVPKRLLGTIHYDVHSPAKPKLVGFFGEICLPVPNAVTDAGFVAASSVPLKWKKAPVTLSRSGSATVIRLPSGSSVLPPPGVDGGGKEVKTAYILSNSEFAAKYLFVRRLSDPLQADCEFIYDIYRWEKGLPVVDWNAYGCDL
jgi:hypothetical protein